MDGKQCCKSLKAVRKMIADENGIPFEPTECTHKGNCCGTCPACEAEVRYIENQLDLRRMAGKAVKIVGLASSMLALSACSTVESHKAHGDNNDTEPIVAPSRGHRALEGDVAVVDTSAFHNTDSAACDNKLKQALHDTDSVVPPPLPSPPPPGIGLEGMVNHKYYDTIVAQEKRKNDAEKDSVSTSAPNEVSTQSK